ncbi:putative FBD-associated F-box protein At5g50270 isoform X2 [Papaver somniferum]|uniref:putative FBD-associated F-box protein At5g50270 isoform X2 n=1 Tax=Papaver somniferum TaxID=3469 RepID=UPI000E6FEF69|nr:putative FBD-associated F-box protein At5g50270 isoform X2 [Papaver somniferum]
MEEPRDSPICNSIDRISNLPENLIHHILSFMDMIHVVYTCVLSKRWKNLWAITPILNLFSLAISNNNQNSGVPFQKFIKFVDQVFILRDNSNIQSVNFVCGKQRNFVIDISWAKGFLAAFGKNSLQFSNLRLVKLESYLPKHIIRALGWLRCISPNVESLSIVNLGMPSSDIPDSEDYFAGVPLDHLRSVEIRGLLGHFNELKLVEIIFKKAVVLEKMLLFSCKKSTTEKCLLTFGEKLLTLPRASSNITTFFI